MRHVYLVLVLSTVLLAGGCQRVGSAFQRSPLPDMGPPLPASIRVEFDPALTGAVASYADACNHPNELRIGEEVESTLLDAAHQTFRTVQLPGQSASAPADVTARFVLQQSGLKIQTDNVYDRLPAELTLESTVVFRDRTGNVLGERALKATRRDRIILEPTQHRCAYASIDGFLHDAAVVLASQFMREARGLFEPVQAQAPSPSQIAAPSQASPSMKPPAGEAAHPAAVAAVPPATAAPGPPATPSVSEPVDQARHLPIVSQPHTYVLAIGIGTHRDPQMPGRKYATLDAEMVAKYFQTAGGVPPANTRVLVDMKALRPDIEEAVLDWLPNHVTSDSIVIVYFSGQAKVSPSGDVLLVPYEGGASASRLYPLKDLQLGLARLKVRQVVLIFDGAVSKLTVDQKTRGKDPQWDLSGANVVSLIGVSGVREGLESDKLHHGLFTYYLLRGLKGEADENLDGEVTLAELGAFVMRSVPAAAKSAFNQEQRPMVQPPLQGTSKASLIRLSRVGDESSP